MTRKIIPFPGGQEKRRVPSPEIASYFTFIWAEFDRLMDLFTYEGLSLDAMVKMPEAKEMEAFLAGRSARDLPATVLTAIAADAPPNSAA
jgi:hypothetical protein